MSAGDHDDHDGFDETPPDTAALLLFLNAAPVGLAQCRLDGSIELMNGPATMLLLPISPNGQLANLFDVLAGRLPQLRPMVAAYASGPGRICQDLRISVGPPPAVPTRQMHQSLTLLKIGPDRLMAVFTDITGQILAEQACDDAKTQLAHLLACTGVGDWALDLASGTLRASSRALQVLGRPADTPPLRIDDLLHQLHPDDIERVTHAFHIALHSTSGWRSDCRVVWPDGTVHALFIRAQVDVRAGRPARMIGIVSDTAPSAVMPG